MRIDIITIFPEFFDCFLDWSMIKKAQEVNAITITVHNLRNWGVDKRGTVDDHSYGGGPGMILRPEPVYNALKEIKKKNKGKVVLTDARGKTFNQKIAKTYSKRKELVIICGHYEGIDQRVLKYMVDDVISIGNYVISGGELAAQVMVDSISRLLPGVLEKEGASSVETFSSGLNKLTNKKGLLFEFPQYTRPENFKGWKVPKVLLSGDHKKIQDWRARKITKK
jgi:tRNA (guanine37-N1)-methyltransferase